MAKQDKSLPAMREDRQIDEQLEELKKEVQRNERLMNEALSQYEDLIDRKSSLNSSIAALHKFRQERRRNGSGD